MLIAEKQQEAHYPQQEGYMVALPKEEFRRHPSTKNKSQAKPKPRRRALPIVVLIVVFSLSCLAIARYAIISQNHQDILELQESLAMEQNRQQHLHIELAERGDLRRIEEAAREDLGMDYPTQDQVKVVSLPEGESDAETEIKNVQSSKKTIIQHIIDIFD